MHECKWVFLLEINITYVQSVHIDNERRHTTCISLASMMDMHDLATCFWLTIYIIHTYMCDRCGPNTEPLTFLEESSFKDIDGRRHGGNIYIYILVHGG